LSLYCLAFYVTLCNLHVYYLYAIAFISADNHSVVLVVDLLYWLMCIVVVTLISMCNLQLTDWTMAMCLCVHVEKSTSKLLLDPDWESTLQIC